MRSKFDDCLLEYRLKDQFRRRAGLEKEGIIFISRAAAW
jgi:hypothetical protein